ncbi:hypothetical protein MLD38_014498 [Melastoma candidum]|uniref:Uncharacterized protein n=1 Tax=Melastoma candidum TaxID=119954 RepID=A0ACB9RCY3_9MYRT|nr:hypothetical protein MLD38_014498 [Melastoma candidum]
MGLGYGERETSAMMGFLEHPNARDRQHFLPNHPHPPRWQKELCPSLSVGLLGTDPHILNPFVELKALLALLLLLQLGSTDNIAAYVTQDTQLGGRQVLNLTIVVPRVCSILARRWSYLDFVVLFIPMFLAGILKYAEVVWL